MHDSLILALLLLNTPLGPACEAPKVSHYADKIKALLYAGHIVAV